MATFKVGDRVRLKSPGSYGCGTIGQEGVVCKYHFFNDHAPGVNFDGYGMFYVDDADLELIYPEMQYDPTQQGEDDDSI